MPSPMHYADWLARHAATRPSKVAVATPNGRMTYAGLYRALNAVAFRLTDAGIRRGETVAICALNPTLAIVLIASLNRMGAVPLVTNRPLKPGVPIQLPDGLAIDRILVEQPYKGEPAANAMEVHLDWLKIDPAVTRTFDGPGLADEHALAHIFTSSGTTGALKAIGFSTTELQARILKRSFGVFAGSRTSPLLCQFGLRSSIGYQAAFGSLWAGGTVYLGFADARVPQLVARQGIERIEASPAQFQGILEAIGSSRVDFSSLKFVLVGGSLISGRLVAAIRNRLCRTLIVQYGATELGMCAFGPIRASDPSGSCGHLVPWIEAEAVDGDGRVLDTGQAGTLRFRAPEMAKAYLNDPEATAAHFRNGWFYPGDLGAIGVARTLTISGRESEVINAGGVKVAPQMIEKVVLAFPGVTDCASFGIADTMGIETIWAAIVANEKADLTGLAKFCGAKLGARAPARFLKLRQLPRNETGKVMHSELQRLARNAARARVAG